jgi:hypothetical protein
MGEADDTRDQHIGARIPAPLFRRVEALRAELEESRSSVVRRLLEAGLQALQRERAKKGTP